MTKSSVNVSVLVVPSSNSGPKVSSVVDVWSVVQLAVAGSPASNLHLIVTVRLLKVSIIISGNTTDLTDRLNNPSGAKIGVAYNTFKPFVVTPAV